MNIAEHDARCTKALFPDMTSYQHALLYGGSARLFCYDGHSAYEPVAAAVPPERPTEVDAPNPILTCKCGAEYDGGPSGKRMYCPPCGLEVKVAAMRAGLEKNRPAPAPTHCNWKHCKREIPKGGRYCSPEHQRLMNEEYTRRRRGRQQGIMAAAFA